MGEEMWKFSGTLVEGNSHVETCERLLKEINSFYRISRMKEGLIMNIKNIVERVRENAIARYENNKEYTNKDEGYQMIVFATKTMTSRKVNDWGRDEDRDLYIGIDEQGWIKYSHTIEYLAGPIKIKNPSVDRLTDEDIISYLQSDECTDEEYIMFMSKAHEFF
jgi:hypothetical protein